jgi:hypothetical protein
VPAELAGAARRGICTTAALRHTGSEDGLGIWFLHASVRRNTSFLRVETVSTFPLSFFINWSFTLIFCLGANIVNEDRNHLINAIGSALINEALFKKMIN